MGQPIIVMGGSGTPADRRGRQRAIYWEGVLLSLFFFFFFFFLFFFFFFSFFSGLRRLGVVVVLGSFPHSWVCPGLLLSPAAG